jgi:hypothetical protein
MIWPWVVGGALVFGAAAVAVAATPTVTILEENPWRLVDVEHLPEHFKGEGGLRDPSTVTTLVLHRTDARGGFGLTQQQVMASGGDPLAALRLRYEHTPYHAVYSPRGSTRAARVRPDVGISVFQWPVRLRTPHGHKSNANSIGWGYDGKIPPDKLDIEGGRASLQHVVEQARLQGAPLRYVEAHAQHSNERGNDPGAEIWREIVRPMLVPLRLEVSTRTTGTGSIPKWM